MACAKVILHAVIISNVTKWSIWCALVKLCISTLAQTKISFYTRFQSLHVLLNFSALLLTCHERIIIGIWPQMLRTPSFHAYKLARTMNENFEHATFLRDRNRRSNQKLREHRWFPFIGVRAVDIKVSRSFSAERNRCSKGDNTVCKFHYS